MLEERGGVRVVVAAPVNRRIVDDDDGVLLALVVVADVGKYRSPAPHKRLLQSLVGRRTTILPHVGDYNKGEKNSIIIIDNEATAGTAEPPAPASQANRGAGREGGREGGT